jgi:hypothetical protein
VRGLVLVVVHRLISRGRGTILLLLVCYLHGDICEHGEGRERVVIATTTCCTLMCCLNIVSAIGAIQLPNRPVIVGVTVHRPAALVLSRSRGRRSRRSGCCCRAAARPTRASIVGNSTRATVLNSLVFKRLVDGFRTTRCDCCL